MQLCLVSNIYAASKTLLQCSYGFRRKKGAAALAATTTAAAVYESTKDEEEDNHVPVVVVAAAVASTSFDDDDDVIQDYGTAYKKSQVIFDQMIKVDYNRLDFLRKAC